MPSGGEGPAAWTEAIGTASATLIAAGAIAGGLWDRRRRIATSVSGWVTIDTGVITHIVLSNTSSEPVFEVVARVIHKGETIGWTDASTLPPGESAREPQNGAVQVYACAADLNDPAGPPRVALLFRDQAGRVWRRRSNGHLRRRYLGHNFTTEWHNLLGELPPILDVHGKPALPDQPPRRKPVD